MTAVARLIPYRQTIEHNGERISFERGAVKVPDRPVPLSLDHGSGALERIGVVTSTYETDEGLYAKLKISDTAAGRDTHALLDDGALTDVSAGVAVSEFRSGPLSGELDHVSVVGKGAFGEAGAGSKVLAVMAADKKGSNVTDETVVEDSTPDPQLTELVATVEDMRKVVAELSVPGNVTEPEPKFTDLREFVLTVAAMGKGDRAAQDKMAEFVLADDTTTGAAGLVPDYFSTEIIGLIDDIRPYLGVIERDPIGNAGMTVKYPRRTQKPAVDLQPTGEKNEVVSQATTFDFLDVPLATYAGASDVSLQLIERSAPSFVTRLFREYAGVYAEATDADAIAAAVVGAGTNTGVLADFGANGAATWAAVAAGAGSVAAGVKRPATHMIVSIDRWQELLELVDADGRPIILQGARGPMNAAGLGEFSSFNFSYGGLQGVVDPHAPAQTCLIMWEGATAYVEQTPQELRALQVSLLGMDMGIWSLFAHVVKYPDGLYSITAV